MVDNSLLSFDYWLLPFNVRENHWTLMIVDMKRFMMLYLDLKHNIIPNFTAQSILSIIKTYTDNNKKNTTTDE